MFSLAFKDRAFVDCDGIPVLQFMDTSMATQPLNADDAESLKGLNVQETRFVQLGKSEMELFANPYSSYMREVGEVTKVSACGFTNWLLRKRATRIVALRSKWESSVEPCSLGERCITCGGEQTKTVCQATIGAKLYAGDALIGLAMLASIGSIKLDDKEEYFWPTREFFDRLCKPLQPGVDDEVLYRGQ